MVTAHTFLVINQRRIISNQNRCTDVTYVIRTQAGRAAENSHSANIRQLLLSLNISLPGIIEYV